MTFKINDLGMEELRRERISISMKRLDSEGKIKLVNMIRNGYIHEYENNRPLCADCDKKISYNSTRCWKCFKKVKVPWNKGTHYNGFKNLIIPKGNEHWNWKGGITSKNRLIRSSHKWKVWRKTVFERDNYTCQDCGSKGIYLHPHHIKPLKNYPKLAFEVNNGKTLCKKCHINIHRKG